MSKVKKRKKPRSAAQKAATKRMIAGLRKYKAGSTYRPGGRLIKNRRSKTRRDKLYGAKKHRITLLHMRGKTLLRYPPGT